MLRRLSWSVLAAWAAVAVELGVVAAAHRGEFTSAWEIAMGSIWLLPVALVSAVLPALFGAAVTRCLESAVPLGRIGLSVAAALFACTVGYASATGRHFAEPSQRLGFAALCGVLAAGAAFGAYRTLAALVLRKPWAFAAAVLAALVAVEWTNHAVLVRLYPGFHAGLAFLALALAPLVLWPVVRQTNAAANAKILGAVLGLALLGCSLSARGASGRLSRFDNFRLLVSDGAPVLRHAVAFAAQLAPPPPLEAVDTCLVDPNGCASARGSGAGLRLEGRDLVIVSIDALRADHVSAYGYPRPTTPGIDALARDGVVFEHAYCATPHTSYSVTSLMTGKYMRPLLLQGTGEDSETLATYLRTYGYRTAAFYPPAVFFIDEARFEPFERAHFGFEYAKVEFLEGEGRVRQVERYMDRLARDRRLLLWVHLFGPHEPYEAQPGHSFGERDLDRYDSEIAAADAAVAAIVARVRRDRPKAVVIVTSDHGEEFGEHGGRYHGTSVYEEQVRVPLVVSAPELLAPRRVKEVVQSIDLLPTLLAGLGVPASPRVRGRDLGPLLAGSRPEGPGQAFAETDESALLAEGPFRLVCARKLGACRLYDVTRDPSEQDDLSTAEPQTFTRLRTALQALGASHGRFERNGLRAETGKGWPGPILRGIAGDADAAPDLAVLLDDADHTIREKAAELLFELRRADTIPALRLALSRDEDETVKRYAALALTRLGESVPLTTDLMKGSDIEWRRLSALALGEAGDARGEAILIDYFQHGGRESHSRALDLLAAFKKIRSKDAVWPLVQALGDVRLRPRIAETLAAIGDDAARGPLVAALRDERYQTARIAIADALVALGAREELAQPLVRLLGVPDPLPGGVGYALKAKVLEHVGGPDAKGLAAVQNQSNAGVLLEVVVPRGGNGSGVRVIVRARADGAPGQVRIGRRLEPLAYSVKGERLNQRQLPKIHDRDYVSLTVPASAGDTEVAAVLPDALGARPGRSVELVLYAERHVRVEAVVLVPLADELSPPPPAPWKPGEAANEADTE